MIYNNLNRTGQIEEIKTKNDKEIVEVYGGIGENNPIYYKKTTVEGVAPLSFKALGQPLTNYTIYGAGGVGDRTENLFNKDGDNYGYFLTNSGRYINDTRYRYFRISVTPGDVLRMSLIGKGSGCAFYKGNWVSQITTAIYTVPDGVDEVTNNYAYTAWDSAMVTINTPLPTEYVPYGYKIPVTCGGENTNIYLDSPLYEGDSISFSTAQTTIPTTVGQNTLSIGTTVQPSKVSIEGNIKT